MWTISVCLTRVLGIRLESLCNLYSELDGDAVCRPKKGWCAACRGMPINGRRRRLTILVVCTGRCISIWDSWRNGQIHFTPSKQGVTWWNVTYWKGTIEDEREIGERTRRSQVSSKLCEPQIIILKMSKRTPQNIPEHLTNNKNNSYNSSLITNLSKKALIIPNWSTKNIHKRIALRTYCFKSLLRPSSYSFIHLLFKVLSWLLLSSNASSSLCSTFVIASTSALPSIPLAVR